MKIKQGWFYLCNHKRKPPGGVRPVCILLRAEEGKHNTKYEVHVYGVGTITVDLEQLEEFYLIRDYDLDAFCEQFKNTIKPDQKAKLYERFAEQLSFLEDKERRDKKERREFVFTDWKSL